MKYLKDLEGFKNNKELIYDIEDIVSELEDDGFNCNFYYDYRNFIKTMSLKIQKVKSFIFDDTLKSFLIRIYNYMRSQKWHVIFVYKLKKEQNDGIRPKKLIIKEVDSL